MAFYTGRTGALFMSASGVGDATPLPAEQALKLRDWSLETSLDLLDTSTVDTAVRSYVPGAVSATGSATLLYYRREGSTSTEPGIQFDSFLGKVMKSNTAGVNESDRVTIILRVGTVPGTTGDVKDDIAFNAYITTAAIQVSTGELSSVAIQFTVDGPYRELVQA